MAHQIVVARPDTHLYDEIEDMVEAADANAGAADARRKLLDLFHHGRIVLGIVASDTEYLHQG